ncbi:MAG: MFS transporter [Actinomycetota bacterium]|nr:MFS transporter [Actinomycetota bacterium]
MLNNVAETKNKNIFFSTISHFIIDLYPAFIVGLIPLLAVKFNLSIFQVSVLTAVSQISNSITQPFFGILSDKHGVKKYMAFGLLTASLFISLIAILPNYFLILLFLFIGNLGVSAFHPPSAAIGAQYSGRKKGFGNSIISLGGNAGYAMGSIFFIAIIEKIGINFSPLAMLPGLLMTLFLIKKLKFSDNNQEINKRTLKFKSIFKIRKAKLASIFLIWFAAFSRDVMWISLLTFLPLHFTKNNISLFNISVIIMLFGLFGGIGGVFASFFSDKLKRHVLIQISYLAVIPLVFLIFKTPVKIGVILFIVSGFFLISSMPLCISISHDLFPKNLSLASSLVMGLSSGMAGITGMLMGSIADNIGIQSTLYIILILLFIALIALFFVPVISKKLK